ncbi:MAG: amidohydrolase family protein [Candidatus Kerfeldbacteria bacterium]|nr:amidohydrolase family protein [Candidatus Kerfeldbacteria bacterium]
MPQPYDLKAILLEKIAANGGFVNCHAHLDKAFLINEQNLLQSQIDMEAKWHLYKELKRGYTTEDLRARMREGMNRMVAQQVKYVRSFVDIDSTVELNCLEAALDIKKEFAGKCELIIVSQTLEGVLQPESRTWIEQAAPLVDVIGGLPSYDRPRAAEHLDIVFGLAKQYGKQVDVHIDQENNPDEKDTELLAKKVIEHGLHGRVNAVHAISLSAQSEDYFQHVLKLMVEAKLNVITCPSAALGMKQLRAKTGPVHNSIARVPEFLAAGLTVAIGTDNIHDFFQPFIDGDMYTEARMLMEACRMYQLDDLVNVCSSNGLQLCQSL